MEYTWRSTVSDPGAQIDLLIDRRDQVINLCEMKYSEGEYKMNASDEKNFLNKKAAFLAETDTKKSIHMTMITANGLYQNEYSGIIQNIITAKELFAD